VVVVEGVVDEVEESSSSPIYARQEIMGHNKKIKTKLLLVGRRMLSSERKEREKIIILIIDELDNTLHTIMNTNMKMRI
jgi:hypothetical protein